MKGWGWGLPREKSLMGRPSSERRSGRFLEMKVGTVLECREHEESDLRRGRGLPICQQGPAWGHSSP